ncbi:shikimate dehydrogenase [Candidatus Bathyarchaeota archaeon]|nr:shikimate dehydrogenase [Candidatus Bathyarchaeota archaeon]
MEISGRTKVCALIGDPVEHSLSPIMHNAAFKHLGLDYVYLAFRVRKEELKDAINGVKALKIYGLNVTKPLKVDILSLLDHLDESALKVGAVNTVLRIGDKLIGYNTDGIGALEALREARVSLEGVKAVILGAGGAARAVAFALAPKVKELVILNRTVTKAKSLSRDLKSKLGVETRFGGLSEVEKEKELEDADLLINATSVGMKPNENLSPVDPELLRPDLTVFDIVYNPIETRLLREARKVGAKVVNGLSMLLFQGAASFSIWTCREPPLEVMREALKSALEERAGD